MSLTNGMNTGRTVDGLCVAPGSVEIGRDGETRDRVDLREPFIFTIFSKRDTVDNRYQIRRLMETIGTSFAEDVLQAHADIRYAAMLRDGQLLLRERAGLHDASSSESDKYEELIVNPTLLTLVGRRGDIDCGGAQFVLIRYGHFFQFVAPMPGGRISIGMEPDNLATYVHIWIARRSLWSAPAAPMGSAIGPGDGEKHEKTSPSAHLGDTCSAILLSRRFLQRHPQRLAC